MSRKAVLVVAAAAGAIAPSTARAGSYDVWSCRGADGSALSAAAWTPGAGVADTCAAGGSLRLAGEGLLRFAPPPGTRIAGYELYRSAVVPRDDWWRDSGAKVLETAGATSYTVSDGTAGDPKQPLAPANRLVAKHAPLDALTLQVSCDWSCGSGNARMDLYRSRVTIDDPVAPAGSAAAAGDDAVIVTGSDRGAGVASITLSLDGGPAQALASGCAPPYAVAPPCPAEVSRAFAIDAADGEHSASGTVVDAAGNVSAWGPVQLTLRRTPAAVAPLVTAAAAVPTAGNGTPAVEAPALRLARATVEHAPGAAATVSGTLRTASGAPIAGARLAVSSLDLAADDAEPRALPAVTTDAAGAFGVKVARDGAQRVTVAFSPRPGADPTARATATVRARLGLAVSSSRGRLVKGRVLTLRGRLRGAGASASGAMVTIESIVNGRWSPVGSTRAKANGGYAWTYRFVHLARDTIFSFRAVVERGPGWPWASRTSVPVKVRVDVP
jgi:hypothetical protein